MKQNITLSLDKDLIRKAKVLAAQRNTSVSGLLTEELKRLAKQQEKYETAKHEALAMLDKGFHLGGKVAVSRDQLHER